MRQLFIVACLLIPLTAQSQEIYRWVDKNGVVHYSDQPGSPDAARVDRQGLNVYESTSSGSATTGSRLPPPAGPDYRGLTITSPTPNQTFTGAGETVRAQADLSGFILPGHSMVFFLDGARVNAARDFAAELGNIDRGTHFLRAAVLDANGEPVITSSQITFHVRMPSIQNPQGSPQAPKPPSK